MMGICPVKKQNLPLYIICQKDIHSGKESVEGKKDWRSSIVSSSNITRGFSPSPPHTPSPF